MGKQIDDLVLSLGGSVKMLADGTVKGYLVRFTDENKPDLTKEYFDTKTDYVFKEPKTSPIYYHHGQDPVIGKRVLGEVAMIPDDVGVWVEGQLKMRDKYDRAIRQLGLAGKLSWSSGTAPHLVEKEPGEKATHITRWPLGMDATLTPTPAEPRNAVTLKALRALDTPGLKALAPEAFAVKATAGDGGDSPQKKPKIVTTSQKRRDNMLRTYPSGGKFHVYAIGEDNEPVGMPVQTFDDADGAKAYIEDQNKPEMLRMAEMFAASQAKTLDGVLAKMDGMQKAWAVPKRGADLTPGMTENGKSFDDFIYAIANNDSAALKAMGSTRTKTLSEDTGASGAYLVPETFMPMMNRIEPEMEIVYPRADRQSVNGPIRMPGISTAGQTAGETNFLGGVRAYWTESGHEKPTTDVDFTQISLNPWELSGYIPVFDQLLSRSVINLPGLLSGLFTDALRFYRDESFLDGTGAGQPLGIINSPGTFIQARLGAGAISYLDLVAMKQHLLSVSWTSAHWIFSISCYESLIQMQNPNGNYIWQENARDGEPSTILGLPYVFTEKTPILGTQGDVVLADERYYYVAEEGGISIASSEHVLFLSNQTVFKFFCKVDGQEKLQAPIYLKDGTTQVSPFVVLGSAATT